MSASPLTTQSQVATIAADDTAPSTRQSHERLEPGTIIEERFHVLGSIGAGAMGVVYEAVDLTLDRRVAIKLHRSSGTGPHAGRMWREAKAMARLAHPNVLTVHQVGLHDERVYIAMELVEGGTVRQWLATRRPWQEVVDLFVQAAHGLAAAHAQDITHRDFKPDNMLLGADGRVRVADFGLALAGEGFEPSQEIQSTSGGSIRLASIEAHVSRTRGAIGTPAYAAPEQLAGENSDPRSDQFSFCVSLYEALWGQRPFRGDTLAELYSAAAEGRIYTPDGVVDVPRWIQEILARGLEPDPSDRFEDMLALASALESDPRRRRRRILAIAGGVGLLGLTAGGSWMLASATSPCDQAGAAIDEVWGTESRARIDARVHEVAPALTADTLPFVHQRLDDYARDWAQQRVEACRATVDRGEQSETMLDLRMACLDRRRAELRSLITEFETADAKAVVRAEELMASLGPLSTCADTEGLRMQVPLPDDPVQRAALEEIRTASAAVQAAVAAGHGQDEGPRAEALVEHALALGNATTQADALLARAAVEWQQRRKVEARDSWVSAHRAAVSVGYARAAYDSARHLALAVEPTKRTVDRSLDWLAVAEGWSQPVQLSVVDRARLQTTRASVLMGAERYAEVDQLLAAEASSDLPPAIRGRMAELRGKALHRLGRSDDSELQILEAIELMRSAHGEHHPKVAHVLGELANVQHQRGEHDQALATYRRAMGIHHGVYGPRSIGVARSRGRIADALRAKGESTEALREYEQALEIFAGLSTPDPQGEAIVQGNYANALAQAGQAERAVHAGERAASLAVDVYGPDSIKVALIRINLGNAYREAGRAPASLPQYERALTILEDALGPDDPNLGALLLNFGAALIKLERWADAEAAIVRGTSLFERRNDPGSTWPAGAATVYAQLYEAQGDYERASTKREQAVRAREALGGASPALREAVFRHGRALVRTEHPADAIPVLERADDLATTVTTSPLQHADILNSLARAYWSVRSHRRQALPTARRALSLAPEGTPVRDDAVAWIAAHE